MPLGVTSQNIVLFIVTAVETSDLALISIRIGTSR
jgi:hypothetical protein